MVAAPYRVQTMAMTKEIDSGNSIHQMSIDWTNLEDPKTCGYENSSVNAAGRLGVLSLRQLLPRCRVLTLEHASDGQAKSSTSSQNEENTSPISVNQGDL